jgi:biuret amidohydrolase
MSVDLFALVAPAHTALVLQEVQNGVVGAPAVLPALAEVAAAVDLVGNCA